MGKDLIRLLRADEIECRIAVIKENGISLLLYKDARVDQRILDEVFGPFGWKRSHESIDGNLYCTVSIRDSETKEWIDKQDVGTSGYAEQEKSQASDSFKRACFNVGIGRELYSAPFIWIPKEMLNIQKREENRGGKKEEKLYCNDRFSVSEIAYDDNRAIAYLVIVNDKGKEVFRWAAKTKGKPKSDNVKDNKDEKPENQVTKSQMASLQGELERTGVKEEQVTERFHLKDLNTMSDETYQKIMRALAITSSKEEDAA